ncbi:MAG: hypothetical protein JWP19_1832 [Rhodoglobus sp.]|nr:hypothetical protein [Rhodoglobus sp.]
MPRPYCGCMGKRILIVILSLVAVVGVAFGGLALWGFVGSAASSQGAASGGPATEKDDDFGTVKLYSVLDDSTLDPRPDGLTQHVWDTFVRVTTPDFASSVMTQYRVGDAPKSDTLAYVYQDDDPHYWILAANLATSKNDADLIATLVHEYAHILTLDGTQMDQAAHSCATLDLSEGCAHDDSYLWAFDEQFWSAYTGAPAVDNADADVAYAFYLAHQDDFVSDYAATNVVEDIAESFMTFVLEDQPGGDSVVAQKLEFFWQHPELVAIRDRIRGEFATDLGLAG